MILIEFQDDVIFTSCKIFNISFRIFSFAENYLMRHLLEDNETMKISYFELQKT